MKLITTISSPRSHVTKAIVVPPTRILYTTSGRSCIGYRTRDWHEWQGLGIFRLVAQLLGPGKVGGGFLPVARMIFGFTPVETTRAVNRSELQGVMGIVRCIGRSPRIILDPSPVNRRYQSVGSPS